MSSREKMIVAAFAVMLFFGLGGIGLITGPFQRARKDLADRQDQLATLQQEVAFKADYLNQYLDLCSQAPQVPEGEGAGLSLPERTAQYFQTRMVQLLSDPSRGPAFTSDSEKLRKASYTPGRSRKDSLDVFDFELRGQGSFAAIMGLLVDVYKLNDLIYVSRLTMTPDDKLHSKKVDATFTLSTVVIPHEPELLALAKSEAPRLERPSDGDSLEDGEPPGDSGDEGEGSSSGDEPPAGIEGGAEGVIPASDAEGTISAPDAEGVIRAPDAGNDGVIPTPDAGTGDPAPAAGGQTPPLPSSGAEPDVSRGPPVEGGTAPGQTPGSDAGGRRGGARPRGTVRPPAAGGSDPQDAAIPSEATAGIKESVDSLDPPGQRLSRPIEHYAQLLELEPFDPYVPPPPPPPLARAPTPLVNDRPAPPPPTAKRPEPPPPPPPAENADPNRDRLKLRMFASAREEGGIEQPEVYVVEDAAAAPAARPNPRTGGRRGGRPDRGAREPAAAPAESNNRWYGIGDTFDGGVIVKLHHLGAVVRRSATEGVEPALWFYPLGELMSQGMLLNDAADYREVQIASVQLEAELAAEIEAARQAPAANDGSGDGSGAEPTPGDDTGSGHPSADGPPAAAGESPGGEVPAATPGEPESGGEAADPSAPAVRERRPPRPRPGTRRPDPTVPQDPAAVPPGEPPAGSDDSAPPPTGARRTRPGSVRSPGMNHLNSRRPAVPPAGKTNVPQPPGGESVQPGEIQPRSPEGASSRQRKIENLKNRRATRSAQPADSQEESSDESDSENEHP